MLSSSKDNSVPKVVTPLAISLEFVWKGKSTYWAGEIMIIDLYVDGKLRYMIDIPRRDDQESLMISLPFKQNNAGIAGSEVNNLIIQDLNVLTKITLKAGIFNKKEGKKIVRKSDGSWSRDFKYIREDVSIDLDLSNLELGNHYKIIATHSMQKNPFSSFWEGKCLHTTIVQDGPSKINIVLPSQIPSATFYNSTPNGQETFSTQQEFEKRKNNSENPHEISFFTLVLEKKYEEAIMYASNMHDQGLGGRLILDLLKYREELGINVNTMNDNPLKQTPLHRVAINKRWRAYYALVERGANSFLPDSSGTSAQEYRSRNGMTIFNTEAQQRIRQDLFGDTAPDAEAFINAVNGVNKDCRVS